MVKKILLVTPEFSAPGWDVKNLPLKQKKGLVVPLNIATIAALTPDEVKVDLWDEAIRGPIRDEMASADTYDLVGITSHSLILNRVKEIARLFRNGGTPVAVGGPDVAISPEHYRGGFDILFFGEAERTWPQFIADWLKGDHRSEYHERSFPDLTLSPPPRWESIADEVGSYLAGAVQTSRGCPFNCEFCQISFLYGHGMRHKTLDRVLQEIITLERLGTTRILFCDSNFIGNPGYTKTLLRELIALNASLKNPLHFQTDLTVNVARDDEMLELLADANFGMLLIGIESPNKESLKETHKTHNYRSDLVADCKKILSYGIPIEASMIVGFDHDTPEIFDQQFAFHQETSMPSTKINILKALKGTALWKKLQGEGRLLCPEKGLYQDGGFFSKDTRGATNIIPKTMTRTQLFTGYLSLVERLYAWENFAARVKGFISSIQRQPKVPQTGAPGEKLDPAWNDFLFSLEETVRNAIFDVLLHTRQHAPFMLRKVVGLISRQYLESAGLPLLRENLLKQIAFEQAVNLAQYADDTEGAAATCVPQ